MKYQLLSKSVKEYEDVDVNSMATGGGAGQISTMIPYTEFITHTKVVIDLTKSREELGKELAKNYALENNKRITPRLIENFTHDAGAYHRVRDVLETIDTTDFNDVVKVFKELYPKASRDWKSALRTGLVIKAGAREGNYANKPFIFKDELSERIREAGLNFLDPIVDEIMGDYSDNYRKVKGGEISEEDKKRLNEIWDETAKIFSRVEKNQFPSEYFAEHPADKKRYDELEKERKEIQSKRKMDDGGSSGEIIFERNFLEKYDPEHTNTYDNRIKETQAVFSYIGSDRQEYRKAFYAPKNTHENKMWALAPETMTQSEYAQLRKQMLENLGVKNFAGGGRLSEIQDYINKNYPDKDLTDGQFIGLLRTIFPTSIETRNITDDELLKLLNKVKLKRHWDKFTYFVNQPNYKGTIKRSVKGWLLYDVNDSREEAGEFNSLESLMSYYDIKPEEITRKIPFDDGGSADKFTEGDYFGKSESGKYIYTIAKPEGGFEFAIFDTIQHKGGGSAGEKYHWKKRPDGSFGIYNQRGLQVKVVFSKESALDYLSKANNIKDYEIWDSYPVKKSKYEVDDKVYSWQNKDYPASVVRKMFSAWEHESQPHENDNWKYLVRLKSGDRSKWMSEPYLFKIKQKEYVNGGYTGNNIEEFYIGEKVTWLGEDGSTSIGVIDDVGNTKRGQFVWVGDVEFKPEELHLLTKVSKINGGSAGITREEYHQLLSDYDRLTGIYEDETDETKKTELQKQIEETEIKINRYESGDDDIPEGEGKVTTLIISSSAPLSTALQALTGNSWSTQNFEGDSENFTEISTGRKFKAYTLEEAKEKGITGIMIPSEGAIYNFYLKADEQGAHKTAMEYINNNLLTPELVDSLLQGYATGMPYEEKYKLMKKIYTKN